MKKSWVVLIVSHILSFIVPIIDIYFGLSDNWSTTGKFQFGISIGIYLTGILSAFIFSLKEKIEVLEGRETERCNLIDSKMRLLTDVILNDKSTCIPLNKSEMYSMLDTLVIGSTKKLELMYLGEKPSSKLEFVQEREKYLETLEKIIDGETIKVKRIIIYTQENKEWIKGIAKAFKGKRKFSLYLVQKNMLPAQSFQIIDDDKVILINISRNAPEKKHMAIISKEINLIYQAFYKNIMANSITIIESGTLDRTNFNEYLNP